MIRALALAAALLAAPAGAHEWYPWVCCSSQDCRALEPGEYTLDERGITVAATGETFAHETLRRDAPDGRVHRCARRGDQSLPTIMADGRPCIWAPEAGI